MPVRVKPVTKQLPDATVAEFTRREADAMDDDQADIASVWAVIKVGEGIWKASISRCWVMCIGKAKGEKSYCFTAYFYSSSEDIF